MKKYNNYNSEVKFEETLVKSSLMTKDRLKKQKIQIKKIIYKSINR